MTNDHLNAILKHAEATLDNKTWVLPDSTTITLYLAHEGVSLTIPRVSSMRGEGEDLIAKTTKKETFAFSRSDLFAVAVDAESAQTTRRAGFG